MLLAWALLIPLPHSEGWEGSTVSQWHGSHAWQLQKYPEMSGSIKSWRFFPCINQSSPAFNHPQKTVFCLPPIETTDAAFGSRNDRDQQQSPKQKWPPAAPARADHGSRQPDGVPTVHPSIHLLSKNLSMSHWEIIAASVVVTWSFIYWGGGGVWRDGGGRELWTAKRSSPTSESKPRNRNLPSFSCQVLNMNFVLNRVKLR